MKPTLPIVGEALAFWDRNAEKLTSRQLLTASDVDSFTLLCITWGKIAALSAVEPGPDNYREMVQLNNLLKQYQNMAKQFGLLPRSRAGMEEEPERDEFGL